MKQTKSHPLPTVPPKRSCGLLILALVALIAHTHAAPALAQEPRVKLELLDSGDLRTSRGIMDMNDHGQIAGMAIVFLDGNWHEVLYRYTDDIGFERLTEPGEFERIKLVKINNAGQIAMTGEPYNSTIRSYRYTDGIGFEDLGWFRDYAGISDINDRGDVVGQSDSRTFIYTDELGLFDPEIFDDIRSWPAGITNSGMVIGDFSTRDGGNEVFAYHLQRGPVRLGSFGLYVVITQGMNDRGDFFGWVYDEDIDDYVDFYYSHNTGYHPLWGWGNNWTNLSDSGILVGNGRPDVAIYWMRHTGIIVLNDLLPKGTDVDLRKANAINKHNQIAGSYDVDGYPYLYRLTLISAPGIPQSIPPDR